MTFELLENYKFIRETPWDKKVFGFPTFEIVVDSEETLSLHLNQLKKSELKGHFTIKIDPLWNTYCLLENGFYYCDTLVEPYICKEKLNYYNDEKISIIRENTLEELLKICDGAFTHGRFHRDFNIEKKLADQRYNSWLTQLFKEKKIWGFIYKQELVGFWGFSENKILLHALKSNYRGKGMAKYFWSLACQEMFKLDYQEISSSISASNLAVLNLYSSLGFKFKNPQNIYHLFIE